MYNHKSNTNMGINVYQFFQETVSKKLDIFNGS